MHKFQILDKEKNPISINKLDADACRVWEKTSHIKDYANPSPDFVNKQNLEGRELSVAKFRHMSNQKINWYDSIGFAISCVDKAQIKWVDVINQLMAERVMEFLVYTNAEKIGFVRLIDTETTESGKKLSEVTQGLILDLIFYYQPYVELINYWSEKGYTPSSL